MYWILEIENEVHSIWVIWTSGLQECKGQTKLGGWDFGLLLLPLSAAMTSVTLIGVFKETPYHCYVELNVATIRI